MDEIQRWTSSDGDDGAEMWRDADGDYVLHADHLAVVAARDKRIAALEAALRD